MKWTQLYGNLPAPLQTVALNAYALKLHRERFGHRFYRELSAACARAYLPEGDLREYQNARLRALVRHAFESVPYYRRRFREHGLSPDDIRTVEDLSKLPLLTREDVRTHRVDLISDRFSRRELVAGHTSGTTGSPLQFFWDREMCFFNNVVDWRQKADAGIRLGEPHAVLFGRMVVAPRQRRPPFWRMNYIHNQLWLSVLHMGPGTLKHYVEKLQTFRPKAIEGYPSAVYALASYLDASGAELSVQAVLTSSEPLYPSQRATIERVFQCRVFDFYGLAERTVFATECDHHEGLHINEDYGVLEVVGDDDRPVPDGAWGWIVGTSLQNLGMPFIRYRTDDMTWARTRRCSCGRTFPLLESPATKSGDVIVTKSGRLVFPAAVTHPFKPLRNILKSQVIQESLDEVIVRLVRGPSYTEEEGAALLRGLHERLGEEMQIRLEYVEDIPRGRNAKFQWVVSKVPHQTG